MVPFQRSVIVAAATVGAAVTVDLPERFLKHASPVILQYAAEASPEKQLVSDPANTSHYSFPAPTNLSHVCRIFEQNAYRVNQTPDSYVTRSFFNDTSKVFFSRFPSMSLHQFGYSWLPRVIPNTSSPDNLKHADTSVGWGSFHDWHLPKEESHLSSKKPAVVVVLLGWLGSQQKHLKKYANWYTSRGIHAITFTLPLKDIVTYNVGGKADEHIDLLLKQITLWMKDQNNENPSEKYVIFHTFSNTGWLTYGAILERLFSSKDTEVINKIKGIVVDSAPVAMPDPQVWALGFSAALFKKQSVAVKGMITSELNLNDKSGKHDPRMPGANVAETTLLMLLENFFKFYFKVPSVNRKLSGILDVLSNQQPRCPQLYFYSTADRVIPAESVEKFVENQKQAGHAVRAYNFIFSPHVDHFRNSPDRYGSELQRFLDECLPHEVSQ